MTFSRPIQSSTVCDDFFIPSLPSTLSSPPHPHFPPLALILISQKEKGTARRECPQAPMTSPARLSLARTHRLLFDSLSGFDKQQHLPCLPHPVSCHSLVCHFWSSNSLASPIGSISRLNLQSVHFLSLQ